MLESFQTAGMFVVLRFCVLEFRAIWMCLRFVKSSLGFGLLRMISYEPWTRYHFRSFRVGSMSSEQRQDRARFRV